MEFKNVLLTKEGSAAVIKMNRPTAFNALDFDMLEGLIPALEVCSDDADVKAVILTGEGKLFCSGGDLALAKQYLSDNTDLFGQLTKGLNRLIQELRTIPKPVIAAINGGVGGAGLSVAAACDLRIAGASAKFRQSYTAVGLIPDGGWSLTLPLLVGYAKAAEMVFLDPVIDASQAKDIGLVHQVADDKELMDVSMALAAKLANGPSLCGVRLGQTEHEPRSIWFT